MKHPFCNCPVTGCPRHPSNHDKGCDPCIEDNLKKHKIPACFFRMVHDDTTGLCDFSVESFAQYVLKHKK